MKWNTKKTETKIETIKTMTLTRRYIRANNSIKLTRLELTNDVSFYGSVNETSVDSTLLSAALAS